jgi:large-conductance mechanosensitive channel
MLHSVVLKKVGYLACGVGIALVVIMALAFAFIQQFAISWAYFITVGVYFLVTGVVIWLIGLAKQSKEERLEQEAEARSLAEDAGQIKADTAAAKEKI